MAPLWRVFAWFGVALSAIECVCLWRLAESYRQVVTGLLAGEPLPMITRYALSAWGTEGSIALILFTQAGIVLALETGRASEIRAHAGYLVALGLGADLIVLLVLTMGFAQLFATLSQGLGG